MGSIKFVPICLQLLQLIIIPVKTIAPLWQCLTIIGIEKRKDLSRSIIRHLLDAVMTMDGLIELQHQPEFTPKFVTEDLRTEVYPFFNGHKSNSNLVTLLAWAEKFDATPSTLNEFFKAKREQPDHWQTVERDHSRLNLRIHLYQVGLFLSLVVATIAIVYVPLTLMQNGWNALILPGESKWWIFLYSSIGPIVFYLWLGVFGNISEGSVLKVLRTSDLENSHVFRMMYNLIFGFKSPFVSIKSELQIELLSLILLSVFWRILFITISFEVYLTLSIILTILVFCLPACRMFKKGSYIYLRKPNPVIRIYDDERSKHWIKKLIR